MGEKLTTTAVRNAAEAAALALMEIEGVTETMFEKWRFRVVEASQQAMAGVDLDSYRPGQLDAVVEKIRVKLKAAPELKDLFTLILLHEYYAIAAQWLFATRSKEAQERRRQEEFRAQCTEEKEKRVKAEFAAFTRDIALRECLELKTVLMVVQAAIEEGVKRKG